LHTVLLGGMMAFALAARNTTDTAGTTSGSSAMGTTQAGSTGNPAVDAQMGISPHGEQNNGPAHATGNARTPTHTGHTTTGPDHGQTPGPANATGNASTPTNTGHTTTGSNNGQ